MSRYLIGNGNDKWTFNDAYNACKDGDVLEFDTGFNLYLGENARFINKSITLEGKINERNQFTSSITGFIKVVNGANVTMSNIVLFGEKNINNIFAVKNSSSATLSNVMIEQKDNPGDGENVTVYPEIYVGENSKIIMERTFIPEKDRMYSRINFVGSTAEIINSTLNTSIKCELADIKITNSTVKKYHKNPIWLIKSVAKIEKTYIEGGSNENEDPCVLLDRANMEFSSSTAVQRNYGSCVALINNSYFGSDHSTISSLSTNFSTADLFYTTINEGISGSSNSKIISIESLDIKGENPEKVDVFLDTTSTFKAKNLNVNRVVDPNFRIVNNSMFYADSISYQNDFNSDALNQILIECKDGGRIRVESWEQVQDQQERVESNDYGEQSENSFDEDFEVEVSDDPQAELDKLIGLHSVKEEINKMVRMVEFNKKRVEQGFKPEENSLHSVFLGNPGTGKTTVARLIGEILFKNGALHNKEKFIFVEACESDLISSYVGKTAEQTYELLEKAKGGILFIDEAYTLNKGDSSVNFGQEAINTILKYMEDHRNEIMIIFAGYTKEMEQFLETNPGLKSRVANKFVFEDYTGDEIVQIGENILKDKQYVLEDEEYYKKSVKDAYEMSIDKSNARWMRNFNEKLLKVFAKRVVEENSDDMATIKNSDIDEVFDIGKYQNYDGKDEDAYEKLNKLIGIEQVKSQVSEFISIAELNKKRRDQGQANQSFSLHSLFLGNPGTGKTTVARILGDILYQKSIIKDNKFIEVSRSDLVAGYVGQTAIKTRQVLKSALGGVLFIDEAYSLCQGGANDFGNEAIDEILKFMEDNRDNIVIILAGYNREMAEFLKMNSGLVSRIPNKFTFEDYSIDEIVNIGLLYLEKFGYVVDKDLYRDVVAENYAMSNDNSNGRWIRNLNEKLIRIMSQRVAQTNTDDLNTIEAEDLMKMRKR